MRKQKVEKYFEICTVSFGILSHVVLMTHTYTKYITELKQINNHLRTDR